VLYNHYRKTGIGGLDSSNAGRSPMAFDEELAGRVREVIGDRSGVTEKRMFGGLAWLVHGHIALRYYEQRGVVGHLAVDVEGLAVSVVERGRVSRESVEASWRV
jgi:hypothetical protein